MPFYTVMSKVQLILGNLAPVMKKMLFYIQPFGIAAMLGDGIFVHKSKSKNSLSVVDEKSENFKNRKV